MEFFYLFFLRVFVSPWFKKVFHMFPFITNLAAASRP